MQFILALICFLSFSYGIKLLEDGYAALSHPFDPDWEPREEAVEEGAEARVGNAETISVPALADFDEELNQAEFDYNFGKFMVMVAIVFAFLAGAFN